MKAVILAAGQGSRLKINLPKCLINLNNVSILDGIVNKMKNKGIKDIYVVTGYNSKAFKNQLVKYRYNEAWYHTEDLYSLMMLKKEINSDDIIIIHSDIIFDVNILDKIMNGNKNVSAAYCNGRFVGMAKIKKDFFVSLSKMKFESKLTIEDIFNILDESGDIDKIEVNNIYNIDTKSDLDKVKQQYKVTF